MQKLDYTIFSCTFFENQIHCGECWLVDDACMQYLSYLLRTYMYIAKKMHSSFLGLGKYNFMVHFASSVCIGKWTYVCFSDIGSVALLRRNAKRNVNCGLSYFEWCSLACMCLLANLYLHFVFHQSKATLPQYTMLVQFC